MTVYVPTTEDLEWTRRAIRGRKVWAVPSGGFVILLDHENMEFTTLLQIKGGSPEIDLFERVHVNLVTIGYTAKRGSFIEGAHATDDILRKMGLTEEDLAIIREVSQEWGEDEERRLG